MFHIQKHVLLKYDEIIERDKRAHICTFNALKVEFSCNKLHTHVCSYMYCSYMSHEYQLASPITYILYTYSIQQ